MDSRQRGWFLFYREYLIDQCGFSTEGLVFILQRVFYRSMWILDRGAGFYFTESIL